MMPRWLEFDIRSHDGASAMIHMVQLFCAEKVIGGTVALTRLGCKKLLHQWPSKCDVMDWWYLKVSTALATLT